MVRDMKMEEPRTKTAEAPASTRATRVERSAPSSGSSAVTATVYVRRHVFRIERYQTRRFGVARPFAEEIDRKQRGDQDCNDACATAYRRA